MNEPNDIACSFSTEPKFGDDAHLISRIVSAYRYAVSVFDGHGDSMWAFINSRSAELHSQLIAGDVEVVTKQLRYPATNDLLSGFDEATREIYSEHKTANEAARQAWAAGVHGRLVRLAEAVGAIPVWMPNPGRPDNRDFGVEALLTKLDDKLGFHLDFPNPYPGSFGLESSRGLINHRALFAIYQAWRLAIWANKNGHTRVLEIGAGSGRTAYYSRRFGLLDYTIIDLPLSNVAQANYLGRALDPSVLILSNEEDDASRRDKIRIFGPDWFAHSSERFDVALNADSMTEIDCKQAVRYFQKLAQQSDVFVSINHEINPFRADELPTLAGIPTRCLRFPYWLDHGYVEEIFLFRNRAMPTPEMQGEIERLGRIILDLRVQLRAPEPARVLIRRLAKRAIDRMFKPFKGRDHSYSGRAIA